jgi:hypothetical protein
MMYMMTPEQHEQIVYALERYQVKRQDFDRFADELAMLKAMQPAFAPDWSRDSAAAESIREHQAICKMLLEALEKICTVDGKIGRAIARAAINAMEKGATP